MQRCGSGLGNMARPGAFPVVGDISTSMLESHNNFVVVLSVQQHYKPLPPLTDFGVTTDLPRVPPQQPWIDRAKDARDCRSNPTCADAHEGAQMSSMAPSRAFRTFADRFYRCRRPRSTSEELHLPFTRHQGLPISLDLTRTTLVYGGQRAMYSVSSLGGWSRVARHTQARA